MLVTVPLLLLLLDYWPLRRREAVGKLVLEKLPLLALAGMVSVITVLAQRVAMPGEVLAPVGLRLENASVSGVIYLRQLIWPANLVLFYPFPSRGLPEDEVALAASLLAAISVWVWTRRKNQPWLLVGWLWYLIMLLPVAGIIQVGGQAHADRYTYLPQIGLCLAATWTLAELRINRAVSGTLMIGVVAALMVCAWKQAAYWKDDEILWGHAVAAAPENAPAHFYLAGAFRRAGRMSDAISEYQEAVRINPAYADAHNNLGTALRETGRIGDAIAEFNLAEKIIPDNDAVHVNLARALLQEGRVAEAMDEYHLALNIQPADLEVENNLAWLLATVPQASLRNGKEAIGLAEGANELAGGTNAIVLGTLAAALAEGGQFPDAARNAQKALDLARAAGNQRLAANLARQLQLYQAGYPLRQ
jgi:tetratricopeptide (TPR) repeat protein